MENRPLEITIISAKGLNKVKHLSKMDVYVTATISGNPRSEQKTPVDKDGGTSPKWNHLMKFNIDEVLAQTNCLIITFKIKCDRTIRGDKEIGEAHVPVKELLDNAGDNSSTKYVTYPVRKPSGKPKGELNFMFKFGDKVSASASSNVNVPVTAYPMHATTIATSSLYHPPATAVGPAYPPAGYPPAGGYGYPSQGGYLTPPPAGYPPVGPGYGYPQVVQLEKKNEFGGLGLGAALVGGVLGGLLIGDMVSDAAAYETGSGYDAGYGDGGDFGF